MSRVWPGFLLVAGLAGCDRHPRSALSPYATRAAPVAAPAPQAAMAAGPWFTPAPQQPGTHLAYRHAVELEIGGGAIAAHFAAARDRCLNDAALHCILLRAEFGTQPTSDPAPPPSSGGLQVRLPHAQVAAYANALIAPLPGEVAGLVHIVRQSTTAEDLGRPMADTGQRMTQLQDYLAGLKSLGSRLTISVSDLVKIAAETSQAQTQMEAAQAEQRDLAQRVETEALDVDFREPARVAAQTDPVSTVLAGSAATFRRNMADMLDLSISAAPWIPLALVGLLLLWITRRLIFGKRR